MSLYFVAPLIVFLIWYTLLRHISSDDASAIESFHSAESLKDEEKDEKVVKKSE